MVARYRTSALRVATVVAGRADESDDIVQVASERALSAIGTVDPERAFRPWYLRVVANSARNHRRALGRRNAAELRLAAQSCEGGDDPESIAVSHTERATVVAALNRLDAESRLVIALRHFEQLSEHEMATALDCPRGTVKSRLSRAMGRLRAELDSELGDDG